MKQTIAIVALAIVFAGFSAAAHADTIQIGSTGVGITLAPSGGGQDVTFNNKNLYVLIGSSSTPVPLTISGTFDFAPTDIVGGNSISPNSGTLTLGNSTVGTFTCTISSLSMGAPTKVGSYYEYGISINLSNGKYTEGTSGFNKTLADFTLPGATADLTFSFTSTTDSTLLGLLGNKSKENQTLSGNLISPVPEPASLALFGTGLLIAGKKLIGRVKAAS